MAPIFFLFYFSALPLFSSFGFLSVPKVNAFNSESKDHNHEGSQTSFKNAFCNEDFDRFLRSSSDLGSSIHPITCDKFLEKFPRKEEEAVRNEGVKSNEWVLDSLKRQWEGRGAHRHVHYTIRLALNIPPPEATPTSSSASSLSPPSCPPPSPASSDVCTVPPQTTFCANQCPLRVLVLQCLPQQLYVDAFEIQNLKGNRSLCAWGDTDVEKPAAHATLSFLTEEFSLPVQCTYGSKGNGEVLQKVETKLEMAFPLHSRYLPVVKKQQMANSQSIPSSRNNGISTFPVFLPFPMVMVRKESVETEEAGIENSCPRASAFSLRSDHFSVAGPTSHSSHLDETADDPAASWHIPVGSEAHLPFVSMVTSSLALLGSVLLSVVACRK